MTPQRRYCLKHPKKVLRWHQLWVKKHPRRTKYIFRKWMIKAKYGITVQEYEKRIAKPCGLCKRADVPRGLDHDHKTGKVRGPLCNSCNLEIGHIEARGKVWIRRTLKWLSYT